jgi:predicted amidophosphoribosyltransferase
LALEWFAEWAAPFVNAHGQGRKVLIPIPSSKTIASSADDFRTAQIARAVAAQCNPPATISAVLRWNHVMPSANEEGGSRDQRVLYPNLTVISRIPAGTCVCIDDVATSGGHLIAAAWKLADLGRDSLV